MRYVTLLGGQSVSDAAGSVHLRSSRTLALVAFLVVHAGRPQPRRRIAGLFWPDSTDEQALTNLRRELHHLRSALGDDPCLVATSRDLGWQDTGTCQVDVRVFDRERRAALAAAARDGDRAVREHATAAVEAYGGELLPGRDDDWVVEARTELERQCVELIDRLGETRARAGDLTGAVEAARRRLRLRPLEELGYRALMERQGDLGDRAGAVRTYHQCASVLERELGIAPDPATRSALNRLLARTGPAADTPAEDPPRRTGLAAGHLVGRSAELEVLRDLWRTASGGRPRLALVRGDAGVGKTRLVAELVEASRATGAVVASTQCFGTSGRLALSPVADWLRTPEIQSGLRELEPVWRAEVDRLVPSGASRGQPAASPRALVDAWQRHRFFEGLTRALFGAGRPTLLIVDNLHWCDAETLTFITFSLALIPDAPVLVVATMRDDEQEHEPGLGNWITRMRATGILTELPLRPLEAEETAALSEAITGRPVTGEERELLQATTGGFPLHVVEVARSSAGAPGRGLLGGDLTAVLRRRLEQATPAARDLAGLAAAVGKTFTLDLLAEASDLDADGVVQAVDELWRLRIMCEAGDGYDFSHEMLRESAYATVSPPKRWLLHRRVAQGLELLHADVPDAVSAQLAEQFARGRRPERAVSYYRRAAEVAADRFAHGEAVRLYGEALAIVRDLPSGRDRDVSELGVLEMMAAPLTAQGGFASPRRREALERAVELAETLGRRESTVSGLVGLWTARFVHGDTAAAYRIAQRALTLVAPDSELRGAAHFAYAGSSLSLGRPAEALRHFELAASLGGHYLLSVGTRPDVHSLAWAAHSHWLLGDDDQAVTSADDAVALARRIGHPFSLAVALAYAGVTHQLRRDVPPLVEIATELRELCDRYGFAYYREWALILHGWSRGDEAGLELARQGVDNLTVEGSFTRVSYWLSLVAELASRTGQPAVARASLDAALVRAQTHDDVWWMPEVMRLRAAYDDPPAAAERLRSAARTATEHGSVALLRRCTADLDALGVPWDDGARSVGLESSSDL